MTIVDRELDGRWDVERTGGLLPPMVGVRKEISGRRGVTKLGPLPGARFDVVGLELRYRFPFRGIVDALVPARGGFEGRTLVLGREVGTFRITPAGAAASRRRPAHTSTKEGS
jgi:hypothetical protein